MILSERKLFCIHFLYSQPHLIAKRASSCISGNWKGQSRKKGIKASVTIETAMVLPFFFLAIVCMFYMMEVMTIRTAIRSGMQYAAKNVAEKVYFVPLVSTSELENQIVQAIGSERLDRSIVVNGSGGIHCAKSRLSMMTGILDIRVDYNVRLPVPVISDITVPMEETIKVKGWCGYTKTGFHETADDIVYVTENGMVYHTDYNCNYLQLSIQCVSISEVDELRNKDQGRYYECESCEGNSENVYITDYGNRYHSSLNCSGLKRTIYAIPLAEAVGKGACTKCGR